MDDARDYDAGQAIALLSRREKLAGDPELSYGLTGKLYKSSSGWLLLSVPNAIGRGAFDALSEHGVELPISDTTGQYNAHISVMRPEEIEKIPGGADAVTERGHEFSYTLGPVQAVTPGGWGEVSKCWFIKVRSPDLERLRKSYGLTGLPNDGEYDFHITFAIRKKKVLQDNPISKAASLIHQPEKWAAENIAALPGVTTTPDYAYPQHMVGYRNPAAKPQSLLQRLLGAVASSDQSVPVVPKTPTAPGRDFNDHFVGMGFRDIQNDGFGNLFMTDPNGREVTWFHEENNLYPTEKFYKGLTREQRLADVDPADPLVNPAVAAAPAVVKRANFVRIEAANDAGDQLQHHFIRANKWDFPAGRIEDGEAPPAAAARELLERTGYEAQPTDFQDLGVDGDFQRYGINANRLKQVAQPGERGGYSTKIRWQPPATQRLLDSLGMHMQPDGTLIDKFAGDTLTVLRRAKAESDRRNYGKKNSLLRKAIAAEPKDFAVDSRSGRFSGITHQPTGFKLHMPTAAIPIGNR